MEEWRNGGWRESKASRRMDWELDCVGRASNRAILPMLNTIGERVATIFPFSRRATLFLSNILYAGGPDSFPFNIQYILFVFFFPLFFLYNGKKKEKNPRQIVPLTYRFFLSSWRRIAGLDFLKGVFGRRRSCRQLPKKKERERNGEKNGPFVCVYVERVSRKEPWRSHTHTL